MSVDTAIDPSRARPPVAEPMRILLVDDNEEFRSVMRKKVTEVGAAFGDVEIEMAGTGREAVRRTMERDYDLILMDVEIPDLNGLQACNMIKQVSLARVALVTALDASEYQGAGRRAGCNHYLSKPPDDADLRAVLRLASLTRT